MSNTPQPGKRRNEGRWFTFLQHRFHSARFAGIQTVIEALPSQKERLRILDVGGRADYWSMLSPSLRDKVHITLMNYGMELQLYAESVEDGLAFINEVGNAFDMPQYADGSFDRAHSNSVVEHVGGPANMVKFASGVRRLAKAYYVQAPNHWFPVDPHNAFPFLHWLFDPVRIFVAMNFRTGATNTVDFRKAAERLDGMRMISRGFFDRLFPDAEHKSKRVGLIFVKSLIATRVV